MGLKPCLLEGGTLHDLLGLVVGVGVGVRVRDRVWVRVGCEREATA